MCIIGNKIYLRRLTVDDVTKKYVDWLNDLEINQYLESRFIYQTIDSTKSFIKSVSNANNYMFGIFYKENNEHIGNIKIGNINYRHGFADLGFLVGEKRYWGLGIATEAIYLATRYAFDKLKIHYLYGGVYAPNIGSQKSFEKNGFLLESVRKRMCLFGDEYIDVFIYSKLNECK